MTFDLFESSRSSGKPIALFLFRVGPGDLDVLGYTNCETPIVYAPSGTLVTFEPTPIERDDIKSSGTLDKTTIDIRLSRDLAIADIFRIYPPSYVVSLVIYEGHIGDADMEFLVRWSGRIRNAQFDGLKCTLTGEPISSILGRPGLRRNWQFGCPYVLYSPVTCKAQKIPQALTLTSILTGNSVRVHPVGVLPKPAVNYTNGTIEWFNAENRRELRNIAKVTAATGGNFDLVLTGGTHTLIVGQDMAMLLGCNHDTIDCETIFDNILNYGGQPWIPLKNPVNNIRTFI